MTWLLLAASGCTDGSCPTFFVNPATGDVKVRGYHPDNPTTERDVVIPAAQWAALIAKLGR